jgi:hypothetical protein
VASLGGVRGSGHGRERWDSVTAQPDLGGVGMKKKRVTGGAYMSAREEREGATARMQKPEEKAAFGECAKASRADWAKQGRLGPVGSWAGEAKVCQLGQIRVRFKTEIGFQISNEFGFWQDFEKCCKEI